MADKNRTGRTYYGWMSREQRIVDQIDQREERGDNRENVDTAWQNYHFTTDGAREWSF